MLPEPIQRVRPGRVDDREPGDPVDQAQRLQFGQGLAERRRVPEIPARHDDPVRDLPVEAFENPIDDRFLPLQPERVDGVAQVDVRRLADLPHALQRVVEIALDLQRDGPVIQGLREFPKRDLPAAHEYHAPEVPPRGGIEGEAGGRVARAGAGGELRAHHAGVGAGGGHAVVLEAARGVQALVLQVQAVLGIHPAVFADAVAAAQQRLALADGDDLFVRGERQQFAEPPDAGEVQRVLPVRPSPLEPPQTSPAPARDPSRTRCPAGRRGACRRATPRPRRTSPRRRGRRASGRRRTSAGRRDVRGGTSRHRSPDRPAPVQPGPQPADWHAAWRMGIVAE